MHNGKLESPSWQTPLQELLLESDRQRALAKMHEVETLLFERLRQLRQSNDGAAERQAIDDALSLLRNIKRDKLGFPDWE